MQILIVDMFAAYAVQNKNSFNVFKFKYCKFYKWRLRDIVIRLVYSFIFDSRVFNYKVVQLINKKIIFLLLAYVKILISVHFNVNSILNLILEIFTGCILKILIFN